MGYWKVLLGFKRVDSNLIGGGESRQVMRVNLRFFRSTNLKLLFSAKFSPGFIQHSMNYCLSASAPGGAGNQYCTRFIMSFFQDSKYNLVQSEWIQ